MLKIKPIYNSVIPKILNVGAITLYPYIFFSATKDRTSIITIQHEMIHVKQVREIGFCSFYISYLLYYLANLVCFKNHFDSYRYIPYEIEAFNKQGNRMTSAEALEIGVYYDLYDAKLDDRFIL